MWRLKTDEIYYPVLESLRIFGNPSMRKELKSHSKWDLVYENLLNAINKVNFSYNIHATGVYDIEYFKKIFLEPILEKNKIIRFFGITRTAKAANILLTFLESFEAADYKKEVLKALIFIGPSIERVVIHTIKNSSNSNVIAVCSQFSAHYKIQEVITLIERVFSNETNLALRAILIHSLLKLDFNNNFTIIKELIVNGNEIEKIVYLDIISLFSKKEVFKYLIKLPYSEIDLISQNNLYRIVQEVADISLKIDFIEYLDRYTDMKKKKEQSFLISS
jgi:hypothetical protein